MKNVATLEALFLEEMSDIHDAEKRFLAGQRAMLENATHPTLRAMIQGHIAETEGQVEVLKRAFAALESKPKRVKCDVAEGLVAEVEKTMKETKKNPTVLDCAIASAVSKVEHYEIASYRGLVASAKEMERDDLVELLSANLEQEEATASKVEQAMPRLLRAAMEGQVVEG